MDQMKKKKRTLVLKFFLIKPEFPYLQKKRLLTCISKGWPTRVSKSVVRLSTHTWWWTPEAQMKAAVDWNKAKLDSSVKFCQYRKMTKEKNQKKKKKEQDWKSDSDGGHTTSPWLSLYTHTGHQYENETWTRGGFLTKTGLVDLNLVSILKGGGYSGTSLLVKLQKTTTTTTTKITHNWAWTTKRWWKPIFFFFFLVWSRWPMIDLLFAVVDLQVLFSPVQTRLCGGFLGTAACDKAGVTRRPLVRPEW